MIGNTLEGTFWNEFVRWTKNIAKIFFVLHEESVYNFWRFFFSFEMWNLMIFLIIETQLLKFLRAVHHFCNGLVELIWGYYTLFGDGLILIFDLRFLLLKRLNLSQIRNGELLFICFRIEYSFLRLYILLKHLWLLAGSSSSSFDNWRLLNYSSLFRISTAFLFQNFKILLLEINIRRRMRFFFCESIRIKIHLLTGLSSLLALHSLATPGWLFSHFALSFVELAFIIVLIVLAAMDFHDMA